MNIWRVTYIIVYVGDVLTVKLSRRGMNFSKGNYFPGTLYSPALKCVGNCLCPSLSVMWALEAEERGLLWPSLLPVKYGYSLPRNIRLDAIARAHSAPKKKLLLRGL